MPENNRIYAYVDWYDQNKGYGIAKNNNIILFFHKSYVLDNVIDIKSNDIISCFPVLKKNIYHATKVRKEDVKNNN